jgi:hypothetical protein
VIDANSRARVTPARKRSVKLNTAHSYVLIDDADEFSEHIPGFLVTVLSARYALRTFQSKSFTKSL